MNGERRIRRDREVPSNSDGRAFDLRMADLGSSGYGAQSTT